MKTGPPLASQRPVNLLQLNNSRKSDIREIAIRLFMLAMASSRSAQSSKRDRFNGKDHDGWQHLDPGSFAVKDGMRKTEGGMGRRW
jgi:hypothetical protein